MKEQFTTLLNKYKIKSIYFFAKKLAQIKLKQQKNNLSEEAYRILLEKEIQSNKSNIINYLKGKSIGKKVLTLWSEVIGCAYEELNRIFHPECYSQSENDEVNNNKPVTDELNFNCAEIVVTEYFNQDRRFKATKKLQIKCLRDLQVMEIKDVYAFGTKITFNCEDKRLKCIRQEGGFTDKDKPFVDNKLIIPWKQYSIILEFNGTAKKDEIVNLVVEHEYGNLNPHLFIPELSAMIVNPTDSLELNYIFQNSKVNYTEATVYQYDKSLTISKPLQDLFFDNYSNSFKVEIPNPILYHSYRIDWLNSRSNIIRRREATSKEVRKRNTTPLLAKYLSSQKK